MKKAPIAVALVLVFGLFAAAFSLSPAVAQNTTTSTNATSTTNTTTATTNATGGGTFSASGSIATLIFDTGETTTTSEAEGTTTASNDTSMTGNMTTSSNTTSSMGDNTTMMPQIMTGDNATSSSNMTTTSNMTSMDNETSTATEVKPPYVAAGDWSLEVQDGSVSSFEATFTMVHIDGTERHMHELSNFVSSNSSTIDTSGEGASFLFGTVDVATNGEPAWTGADALIIIEKNNVVSISLATEDTDDHFMGQPIYGIVESMTDEDGNELIDTGTATAGNATGGNATGGNQTAGGMLDNLTGGIQDFFNGTGP